MEGRYYSNHRGWRVRGVCNNDQCRRLRCDSKNLARYDRNRKTRESNANDPVLYLQKFDKNYNICKKMENIKSIYKNIIIIKVSSRIRDNKKLRNIFILCSLL